MSRTLPRALRPFGSPDYRILAIALVASLFGSGMWAVAMVYEVIELGGDALALSAVGTATSLGLILSTVIGGIAADRLPKRWILRTAETLNVLGVGTAALLSTLGLIDIWHLAVAGAILGAATGLFFPAYSAILPSILPEDDLLAANGIEGMSRPMLVNAAGPAVAGMLTAAISPGSAIAWIALCHLLALLGMFRLHPRVDATKEADLVRTDTGTIVVSEPTTVWHDLVEGVRYTVKTPWLLWTLLYSCVVVFAYVGPFEVLTPFLLRDKLGLGADAFAAVLATFGISAAAGSLVTASMRLPRRYLTLMMFVWGLPLAAFALFGFVTELWHLFVIGAIVGFTGGVGNVIWGTLLQRRVPRHMLGRVSSLDFFVSLAFMPVSMALAGPLARVVSLEWIFIGVAVVSVVTTVVCYLAGRMWRDELAHPLDTPDAGGAVAASSDEPASPVRP